jgi:hypothetical protein
LNHQENAVVIFLPNYLDPPEPWLRQHAAELYARRSEGVRVPRVNVQDGDWVPLPNNCHGNVTRWVLGHPDCKIVRGWLYLDLDNGALGYVRFVAHSVVWNPDRKPIDITPALTENAYPFIPAFIDEDQFEAAVTVLTRQFGAAFLDHLLAQCSYVWIMPPSSIR